MTDSQFTDEDLQAHAPLPRIGANMTDELKPTLLPCPFCGRDNSLITYHDPQTTLHPWYRIECDYCGAKGPGTDKGTHEKEWNRRPSPPAGDERGAWSLVLSILHQGAAIQQDYQAGKFANYEEYAARMDCAARERAADFVRASFVPSAGEAAEQAVIQSPVFEYQKARTLPTELTSTKSPAPQPAMWPDPHDDNPHAGQCCNRASRKAFGDCPYCGRKAIGILVKSGN